MIPELVESISNAVRPTLGERVAVGTLTDVPASIRELPQSRAQQQYGLDDVRLADLVLLRADLYATAIVRDTVVTVAGTGPQAGAWYVLDPLSSDDIAIVVRLRRSLRHSSATPGATTIR
jgi:hypothetical protein